VQGAAQVSRAGPRAAQWRKQAVPIWRAPGAVACRGEDTGLFYKAEQERPEARQARAEKAKGLCAGCCARTECLEAAMAEEQPGGGRYGIRGGLTEEERKDLQVSRTLRARNERKRTEKAAEEAA
jgi:WhiB family redox-sensing transcriptional regulator